LRWPLGLAAGARPNSGRPGFSYRCHLKQAIALGGDINYLTADEGAKADAINFAVIDRIWNLWKLRIAPSLAK
jgi:hypothetical protein